MTAMKMDMADFILIGGGIVGVSTAWQLQQRYPEAKVVLIEKESHLAHHQTGRNSGVIHAGVYYAPGSLKANFCKRGAALTFQFCKDHGLPFEQCGKLLVATDAAEYQRMEALEARCQLNDIQVSRLSGTELRKEEPLIRGEAALLVSSTGITDYSKITAMMARQFQDLGGVIRFGDAVHAIREESDSVRIQVGNTFERGRYLVTCGGLMADRIVKMMGMEAGFQILPFRGEYFSLSNREGHRFAHLIYPIPDPHLPFLGVHITRMIDGTVTVGPNAVLGWKREGYHRVNFNLRDTMEMLKFSGFWKVMRTNWYAGLGELRDSFLKSGYLKRIQKYCPTIIARDLRTYPTGIRAQAVLKDGSLVHDFLFIESDRALHVCNAPSPAATSALPIGEYICDRLKDKFSL